MSVKLSKEENKRTYKAFLSKWQDSKILQSLVHISAYFACLSIDGKNIRKEQ